MDAAPTLDPATRIGQFTIVSLIGAGGMGEVYRASDPRLGRDVAIKVLPREVANDRDRLSRLQQEARAAGMLNHPNLLTVHELGVHEGLPFIVTELLEGKSLRAVLDSGPLPLRKVIDYGVGIANGLSAAHEKGIVHRDLKPENIFITNDGRVKILDFGLAKIIAVQPDDATPLHGTEPGVVVGTTGYLSPEQVRGDAVDARSDLFAVGMILYEMLTGRRAFQRSSRVETLHAILKEEPAPLSAVPQSLQRVVRHCLEKHPPERFQCARDLSFALETSYEVADDAAVQRSRVPLLPVLVAAVVILAAVAVTAWMLLRHNTGALPLTIQRLTFRNTNVTNARFTGDGRTVVYSLDPHSDTDVYTVRTDNPESKPSGFPHTSIVSISSTGDLLLKLGQRDAPSQWGTTGTLARVNLTGSVPRELLPDIEEADWDPTGSNIAITRSVAGKCRIEFPPGNVLYETTGWVSDLRISPDGGSIAFADHPLLGDDAGSVAVITPDRKLRKLGSNFDTVLGLAWRTDGHEVWFTAGHDQRSLRAVDMKGRERTLYVAPGLMTLHDVAADGRALVTLALHQLKIAFISSNAPAERDLSWMSWSIVSDLSPDGKSVLFNEQENGIFLRRTDGSAPVKIGEGYSPKFSPDGDQVLAVSSHSPWEVVIYRVGAGEARQVTHDALRHDSPCWLPDGKRILFMAGSAKSRRIFIQDLAGGVPRKIGPEGFQLAGDAASPDGRTILVQSAERIGLLSTNGGEPRMLPDSLDGASPLRWNRKGTGFYFLRGSRAKLYEYDVFTGRIRQIELQLPERQITLLRGAAITPDGHAFAVDYPSVIGDLYVFTGLK